MPRTVSFAEMTEGLKASPRMPVVFLGHGSPMNVIDDNSYTAAWAQLGQALPKPQAVLAISAHWMTRGTTLVHVSERPRTIHDFGGFPQALFDQQYPAPGAPDTARAVAAMLKDHADVGEDVEWGLDHGAWAVLAKIFPEADVPVFQLSIDLKMSFQQHVELARDLKGLRDKGVLVMGSGNLVHNLGALRFDGQAQDFAIEFDTLTADWLVDRDVDAFVNAPKLGALMQLAHPTVEHYIPALYSAALADDADDLAFFAEGIDLGAASMRSFIFA
ncbi:4,5-DOPA dioxygenase extradiol [Chachezhania antarctica]|uniref:4,5-DOPA-extradiol-dioxygenase n=1 Tax=Chachezhania antarctica TaxID=2340860 RepID=UPI000EAC346F|nr:4,5-DOPA dioxygenase extradiol [Chachezhania antarctica]